MLSKEIDPSMYFYELPYKTPQTLGKKVYWNGKKCRSCKYSPNVKSMTIFVFVLFFISLSMNKKIGDKCYPVLEPPQILKVMQFVCKRIQQK